MKSLSEFYADKEMCTNVKSYLDEFIKSEGIRMLFERENIEGVADAKEIIDKAWENLELMFAPKQKKKIGNEAR